MTQYINKSAVVAEIERRRTNIKNYCLREGHDARFDVVPEQLAHILSFIDTLEVKDPYELVRQHSSIKDAIQAHAETYSFNIESELFNQLTKEQQELWRKEIEYACISGGDVGYSLAKDPRYKENLEVKEADLEEEIDNVWNPHFNLGWDDNSLVSINHKGFESIAKHFFELGLQTQKGE